MLDPDRGSHLSMQTCQYALADRLFSLLPYCNFPTSVEANDIQLSGLSQNPTKPVSGSSSDYGCRVNKKASDRVSASSPKTAAWNVLCSLREG
jgi:hypothetical protein